MNTRTHVATLLTCTLAFAASTAAQQHVAPRPGTNTTLIKPGPRIVVKHTTAPNGQAKLEATLLDQAGTPLKGKRLVVTKFDDWVPDNYGHQSEAITNAQGRATFDMGGVNGRCAGTYPLEVKFWGDATTAAVTGRGQHTVTPGNLGFDHLQAKIVPCGYPVKTRCVTVEGKVVERGTKHEVWSVAVSVTTPNNLGAPVTGETGNTGFQVQWQWTGPLPVTQSFVVKAQPPEGCYFPTEMTFLASLKP
jgi:hypothetical protein